MGHTVIALCRKADDGTRTWTCVYVNVEDVVANPLQTAGNEAVCIEVIPNKKGSDFLSKEMNHITHCLSIRKNNSVFYTQP